ncbi:hypothetical protein AAGG74_15460 [Bacillus mexicanus]|uniref:hypothetical protein n=1 Tax=Bacillus mexicanus TaxID=2834415 RepID=UPI003D25E28C
MEVKIEEVYGEIVAYIKKKYIVGRVDESRAKIVPKLNLYFNELKNMIEADKKWGESERINSYYKSSLTSCDLSIRVRKEDIIKMFKTIWKLNENEINIEGWGDLHINCYRAGKYVADHFDYRYELEIIVDETEEENLFKKLFLMLPLETEKSERYENIFGTVSYKYKMVVLNIISEYFKEELIKLKIGLDNSMDKLTLITIEKLGL